jgi:hypothetical protein
MLGGYMQAALRHRAKLAGGLRPGMEFVYRVFQMAMRRAMAVSCMLVCCWWKNKGNEGIVRRNVDFLNATRRRSDLDSRIWQYNRRTIEDGQK